MKHLNYDKKIERYNKRVKDSYKKSIISAFMSVMLYFSKTLATKEELTEFICQYINTTPQNLEVILYWALTISCLIAGTTSIWNVAKTYENSEARQKYVDSEINKLNKELNQKTI